VKLDLATGARVSLTGFTGTESLAALAYSPSGDRISFSRWTGRGFDLFVRGPDGAIEQLTFDGRFNFGARWVDERRLVFLREHAEPLRGYEDFPLFVNHAAVGGVRYRVPLIIDRGWSSLAYLFPSVHFRELDLEGFAQAVLAADNAGRRLRVRFSCG
jgi:hypothetical protein